MKAYQRFLFVMAVFLIIPWAFGCMAAVIGAAGAASVGVSLVEESVLDSLLRSSKIRDLGNNRYSITYNGIGAENKWFDVCDNACGKGNYTVESNQAIPRPDKHSQDGWTGIIKCNKPIKLKNDSTVKKEDTNKNDNSKPEKSKLNNTQYCLINSKVNMRSDSNTKSKIVSVLQKGDKVEIIESLPKWAKVKSSSGLIGWVFKKYLISYD